MLPAPLYDLLQACTVRLTLPNGSVGTGFFVAPGYVLTCEHVVRGVGDEPIRMRWQQEEDFADASVEKVLDAYDIALLKFAPPRDDLPCVYLDEALEVGHELYLFGYTNDPDYPNGRPVTPECEGFTGDEPPFIMLEQGHVQPGMSGAALLNRETGRVCGMAKFTRDQFTDLGGGGVKAAVILQQLPELVEWQRAFHERDRRWVQLAPAISLYQLPRLGAVEFVGRDTELRDLHNRLEETDCLAITAIQGMGGIGKTELALRYAYSHLKQPTYPGGICWLQARDQDLASQLVEFAKTHQIPIPDGLELAQQVAAVWKNWPLSPAKALIIYDDVADFNRIQPYLPPKDPKRFRVLLTTRQRLTGLENFEIDVLSEDAALELLQSIAGAERINVQLADAQQLCKRLGYLPLALELVGRYLELDEDLTIAEVQAELEEMRTHAYALLKDTSAAEMTAKLGVAEAFELSLTRLDADGQNLATLLSLFAAAPIPWERVQTCLPDVNKPALRNQRNQLRKNSLLQRVGPETYQIHPLIHEFLRVRFSDGAEADALKRQFCQGMVQVAKQIPQTPTQEQILAATPLIPHLSEAATTWQPWLADDDLIWPFVGISRFYEGQGAYAQAEPWCEQCLTVTRQRLGEAHPDVALSLNNLAALYYLQGRYSEAEPLYEAALALRKRLLGDEHPDVAGSLNNLAALYYLQGRYSEAEPLCEEALALRQRLLGEAHPDVAQSLHNLAALYYLQGRYSEAEPLYQEALALRKRLLGDEHPDVADSLNNLAALYHSQGRYSEAEPLYQEALALSKRLLGEAHPDVAQSLNNLAALYQSQGRYSEAELLYQEALALRKRLLGEAHPDVAQSLNNLALLYNSQGRYSEAEPLAVQALNISHSALGDDHPDVGISLGNLASLYVAQKRYTEAESLFLEALRIFMQSVGQEHPHTTETFNRLVRFITAVVEDGQTEVLSNHPITQALLQQLQSQRSDR